MSVLTTMEAATRTLGVGINWELTDVYATQTTAATDSTAVSARRICFSCFSQFYYTLTFFYVSDDYF